MSGTLAVTIGMAETLLDRIIARLRGAIGKFWSSPDLVRAA